MASLLLFCFVIADLIGTLSMARPFPVAVQMAAIELHRPGVANPPSSSLPSIGMESGIAGAPEAALHRKHHAFDKSIAGGEVILGGLAMAIFAAIFCYIRITRQRDEEEKS